MLNLLLTSILLPNVNPASAEELDFFEKKIRPVFLEHCTKCHGESKQQGGLRLDTKSHFLKGGDSGPLFDATKPADQSRLMKVLHYNSEEKMPPKGKLPDPVIADIRTWLSRNAPWPDESPKNTAATKIDFSSHWAFRKIESKPLPQVSRNDLAKRPLDKFIESQLEEKGLSLSPEADRRTLVKRLYLVLLGLMPTPQQVETFEKDTHPNAYENLVRSLLDSPHFGERWARHWMDLARYADNKGYIGVGVDRTYPYAYTYRDWLIHSFN